MNQLKRGVLGGLCMLSALAWADEPTQHKVIPIVAHLEGVGSVVGVGLQSEKVGEADYKTTAGLAIGDIEGGAFNISDISAFKGKLSFSTFAVTNAEVETQYSRGTEIGTQYQQELSGVGQFANLKTHFNQQQYWYANLGMTLVSFGDYSTSSGEVIGLNDEGLHDVFSTLVSIGVATDERDSFGDESGLLASVELAGFLFRPGQSDQGQLNYASSYTWAFEGQNTITAYARGSHGFVLAKKSDYDEVDEVLAELNGQCSTLGTEVAQNNCSVLELELAQYIVDSNNKGNAQALGGAYGLRSYNEQYVKAANTFLQGIEGTISLPLSVGEGNRLELISFMESAQASDRLAELFDDSLYSVGVGARLNVKDTPIRLEVARGSDDTEAWFFTAGKKW